MDEKTGPVEWFFEEVIAEFFKWIFGAIEWLLGSLF